VVGDMRTPESPRQRPSRSVDRAGWRCVGKLPDGIRDPAPYGSARRAPWRRGATWSACPCRSPRWSLLRGNDCNGGDSVEHTVAAGTPSLRKSPNALAAKGS